jgi:transcriptional regulator with XRE-family HTH domain
LKLARTKEWRESQGLTQRELAAEAGVGEVTVARIEADASVSPPTARKVADALGVSVADLLERPPVPLAEAPPETGQQDTGITHVRPVSDAVEAIDILEHEVRLEKVRELFGAFDRGEMTAEDALEAIHRESAGVP